MSNNNLSLRVLFNMVDSVTGPLRNILQGNNQVAGSLRETRDRLKELNKTQRDIGALRELRTGMAATAGELNAAKARVAALGQAMNAAGPPTQAMVREFEQARNAARTLQDQHRQQYVQLHQLRTGLAGAGIDTRNLAQHERDLRANIQNTTAEMQRQQQELTQLAARERRLGEARARMQRTQETAGRITSTGVGMAATGAATTAALSVPVSEYAKAEDSATQLSGALMRAGAVVPPEFGKINALAMKMGDKLPGTTSDFQDMMTMLSRQGISAQSILGGMGEATAYLGVQLKKAPADAAEFAAKMQDATKTTEKDMLSLMDVIQRTYYLGVDDNNMLNGMAKLSPAMDTIRMKGLQGAKAVAPLLVMADQSGMAGESAGNAYRKIFQMGMDKKKIAKANKGLAPAQQLDFTDGKGEFGGFDKMFKQFDKLKGLTTQKRLGVLKEVFGDDAETLQVVSLLMEKGVDGYREVQGKMAAQASLQERVTQQLGTLKNLWEAAGGTFTNTMVAFGETLAPELKATTEWLGDAAQKMGAWARENPRLAGGLMKTAAALAIVLTVVGALLVMIGGILGPLAMLKFSLTTLGMQGGLLANVFKMAISPLKMLGQAVLFIGRALLMNPIGLAVTGIAVAAFMIYKYWGPIKGFFGGLWDQVRAAFTGGIGAVGALLVNWSPAGLFYRAFAGVMSYFGVDMPSKLSEFGGNIITSLTNSLAPIGTFVGGLWDQVKAAFNGGIGAIGALLANWSPVGLFYQAFAAVMSYFGIDLPAKFSTFGANIIAGLVNGITSGLGAVKTAITSAADSTVGWFKEKLGIKSPSRVFGELGGFISQGAAVGIESEQGKVAKAVLALATVASASFAPTVTVAAQLPAAAPVQQEVAAEVRASVPAQLQALTTAAKLPAAAPAPALLQAVAAAAKLPAASPAPALLQAVAAAAKLPAAAPAPVQLQAATAAATLPAVTAAAKAPIVNPVPIDSRGSVLAPKAGAAPAAAGGSAGGGTNTYTITINPAPGMDPVVIARAVAAELDRRERAKQARVGSRLQD
jgi:TP901 family phage tail tape measure protein